MLTLRKVLDERVRPGELYEKLDRNRVLPGRDRRIKGAAGGVHRPQHPPDRLLQLRRPSVPADDVREVWRDFLAGNGISHFAHLERFETLIGSDSHTSTAGALAMVAIGTGGAEVAAAMAGEPFYVKIPKVVRVNLVGELSPWLSAKDVILELLRRVSVKGRLGQGHGVRGARARAAGRLRAGHHLQHDPGAEGDRRPLPFGRDDPAVPARPEARGRLEAARPGRPRHPRQSFSTSLAMASHSLRSAD